MLWYEIVLGAFLLILAIVIIVAVLGQEGRRTGIAGAISGGAETFLSKNKAKSVSGKLRSLTKVLAIVFLVLVLAVNIILWIR